MIVNIKQVLSGILAAAGIILNAQTAEPQIVKTSASPFKANGRPVEAVWKKADQLTGFSIPRQARVAIYQTWGSMMYDENNLYIMVRKEIEPKTEFRPAGKVSPFAQTNVEVLIRPDLNSENFFQICAAQGSDTYTAAGFQPSPIEGLKVWTYKDSGSRFFNFMIPLKSIGLEHVKAGQKIGFNLCGANYDLAKGVPHESSSFTVLETDNFRVPSTWNIAEFSA